jgi:hypothetical protein
LRKQDFSQELNLTADEQWVVEQTLKTGNLDLFSERFMRLPNSGTRWMPGDSLGHYRHIFNYELLYDGWLKSGRPEDTLKVTTPDHQYGLRVIWSGDEPHFLLPHGYLFLDWAKPVVSRKNNIALVIAGTGTAKTSSMAVAALIYCVLFPGYNFMNAAPTEDQSQLMIDEMEKWVTDTPFTKFIKRTNTGALFIKKPSAVVEILSPFNTHYPSKFVCKTTGKNANNALGKNLDCACLDEIQLMENIDDILDKTGTRSRAGRATGEPRDSKVVLLTNPGDNPNLSIVAGKVQRIIDYNAACDRGDIVRDRDKPRIDAIYIKDLDSSVNPYITLKQLAYQGSMMDAQSKRRWLMGMIDTSSTNREIPPDVINRCIDQQVTDEIRINDMHEAIKMEGLGIVHYEIKPVEGRQYIVLGDPGKTAPTRMSYNNIGTVMVLDITNFLEEPTKVVYYDMVGDGTYKPWMRSFKYAMLKYRAKGYYDATNLGVTGFEDAGVFEKSPVVIKDSDGELYEGAIRINYSTSPITFAAMNKRWARTLFVMMAEDKQFGWPHLERLSYEASVYAESGPNIKSNADDTLAALFVFSLALQSEGVLWSKFTAKYHWDREEDEAEEKSMLELALSAPVNRNAARGLSRRSSRTMRR